MKKILSILCFAFCGTLSAHCAPDCLTGCENSGESESQCQIRCGCPSTDAMPNSKGTDPADCRQQCERQCSQRSGDDYAQCVNDCMDDCMGGGDSSNQNIPLTSPNSSGTPKCQECTKKCQKSGDPQCQNKCSGICPVPPGQSGPSGPSGPPGPPIPQPTPPIPPQTPAEPALIVPADQTPTNLTN